VIPDFFNGVSVDQAAEERTPNLAIIRITDPQKGWTRAAILPVDLQINKG
jgi:hypothetical protein